MRDISIQTDSNVDGFDACGNCANIPQPLYNMVHYNMVLDIIRISVGAQIISSPEPKAHR